MPVWSNLDVAPQEVDFLLFDRFSNLCLASAVEPLRAANWIAGRPLYRWRFLTPDGAPATSSSGVVVSPEAALGPGTTALGAGLGPAKAGDLLVVIASYDFRKHAAGRAGPVLRAAARRFRTVAGLDTGGWLMAAAGLLQGRSATVHWSELDAFAEQFPEIQTVRTRFVVDGDRITCAGGTAALDWVLAQIGERHGEALRLDVAALFLHDAPPTARPNAAGAAPSTFLDARASQGGASEERTSQGRISQGRTSQGWEWRARAGRDGGGVGPRPRLVDRALELMRAHLEDPLSIEELARRLGKRQRDLEERFRRALGATPRDVYRHLRLAAARQMVEDTDLAVSEIAVRCGYADPSALTRAFRRAFGRAPREIRRERAL